MHAPAQVAYEPSVAQSSVRSGSPGDVAYPSPGSPSSDAAYDDVPVSPFDGSTPFGRV